jgi:hypothetical protein
MKIITKLSMATAGLTLLTLASSTTASAIQLQASGNISGFVSRGPSPSSINNPLGVQVGDIVQGSYSVTFDSSVFSTESRRVFVPLDSIEVSVGTQELIPSFRVENTESRPSAYFTREGDFFAFDSVVADFFYFNFFQGRGLRIPVTLIGGTIFGSRNTGFLTTRGNESLPVATEDWSAGFNQTCQGSGCQFRVNTSPATSVPESSSTTGLLAFGILGISLFVKDFLNRKVSLQKK